jgi:hypothetical protein
MKLIIFIFCVSLFFGCFNQEKTENNLSSLSYETVDSIIIESTDQIKLLSYDQSSLFLFLELTKNNLILYDQHSNSTLNLNYLKNRHPQFNDQILAACLSDNNITAITYNGNFQFSLEDSTIVFSNKSLIARTFGPKIIPFSKNKYISNLTPLNSVEKGKFEEFSFVVYDSIGRWTNFFCSENVKTTPDIRTYIEFNVENDEAFQYIFPYNKLYSAKISNLVDGEKLKSSVIDVSFLENHPYYNKESYHISDFPYIPSIYGMYLDKSIIYLHLAEGGDKRSNKYKDSYSVILLNKDGSFLVQSELPAKLFQIIETIDDSIFLFTRSPKIEYKNKTAFDIVKISGIPATN